MRSGYINVLAQVAAANAALQPYALALLKEHLNSCVTEAMMEGRRTSPGKGQQGVPSHRPARTGLTTEVPGPGGSTARARTIAVATAARAVGSERQVASACPRIVLGRTGWCQRVPLRSVSVSTVRPTGRC
ncbi:metal-sensing transcriptional repressor [Streptomyces variabilis]